MQIVATPFSMEPLTHLGAALGFVLNVGCEPSRQSCIIDLSDRRSVAPKMHASCNMVQEPMRFDLRRYTKRIMDANKNNLLSVRNNGVGSWRFRSVHWRIVI